MHVALTPKLCAKQKNGDPLRWNDRLIAFNELFWHGAVRGALSQIKVIWHDPSELSAPVHLEHASVCLRGVWYLCWCLYFWSEEVGLTHLMERNVQRRPRDTQDAFSSLALIQTFRAEWWFWGRTTYLKMNGRKKALDVFQRENTSEWDTGSSTCFNSLSRTAFRCAFVRFWQVSLWLKAPHVFGC